MSKKRAYDDFEEMVIKEVRVWMEFVLQAKKWSAQEWATAAGTTPTNITRFLKQGEIMPTYLTLRKLEQSAGIPLPAGKISPAKKRAAR